MRFHCGISFNWKTIKKWLIPILIGVLLLFSQKLVVNAETFNQNNRMSWNLTNSSNQSLNSGTLPFYTSYMITNLNNYQNRVYLKYNNYTAYTNYYYDLQLTLYYSDLSSNAPAYTFFNTVNYCNIYVDGSTNQRSDGCSIIEKDNTHITIRTFNLKTEQQGLFSFQFNNNANNEWDPTIYVQVNSYSLDINAKIDTSVSSAQVEQGFNSVINNQNNNTTNIINNQNSNQQQTNQRLDDINNSINDSSIGTGSSASSYFGDNIWLKNYGISSLITIPIDFIQNLTNETCTPITLNLPFVENKTITLPCISTLMSQNFSGLFDLYQLIIGGFIGLYCGLHIYRDIEDAINPYKDMPVSQLFIG